MRRRILRPAEDTADGLKAVREADAREWWASVLGPHEPDDAGLCKVCVDVRTGDARNLAWPFPTHAMTENALILRAQRDRTDRGDNRPLR